MPEELRADRHKSLSSIQTEESALAELAKLYGSANVRIMPPQAQAAAASTSSSGKAAPTPAQKQQQQQHERRSPGLPRPLSGKQAAPGASAAPQQQQQQQVQRRPKKASVSSS